MNNLKISLASKIAKDLRTNIILGILEEGRLLNGRQIRRKPGTNQTGHSASIQRRYRRKSAEWPHKDSGIPPK